jgi:hypothetical protein
MHVQDEFNEWYDKQGQRHSMTGRQLTAPDQISFYKILLYLYIFLEKIKNIYLYWRKLLKFDTPKKI